MLNPAQASNILLRADIEKARLQWAKLASTYDDLIKNTIDIAPPVLEKYLEIKNLIDDAEKIVPNLFNMDMPVDSSELNEEIISNLQDIIDKKLLGVTEKSFACLTHYIEIFKRGGHVVVEKECLDTISFAAIIINKLNQQSIAHRVSMPNEIKVLVDQIIKIISRKEPMLGADPRKIYFNSFLFKALNVKDINRMSLLENAYVQLEHFSQCCFHKDNVIQTISNYLHGLPDRWQIITQLYSEIYNKDEELSNLYSKIDTFINDNQLGINLFNSQEENKLYRLTTLSLKDFFNFTYEMKKLYDGFVYNNCIDTLACNQIQLNINAISGFAELEAKMSVSNINSITTEVANLAFISDRTGAAVESANVLGTENLNYTAVEVLNAIKENMHATGTISYEVENKSLGSDNAVVVADAFLKSTEGIAAVQTALLPSFPALSEYGTRELIKALRAEKEAALGQVLRNWLDEQKLLNQHELKVKVVGLLAEELQNPRTKLTNYTTSVVDQIDTNNDPFLSGFVNACKSKPALQELAAKKVKEVLLAGVANEDELKEEIKSVCRHILKETRTTEMSNLRMAIGDSLKYQTTISAKEIVNALGVVGSTIRKF